ncbi:F protein [Brachyspira hyodysenteriae]|uniref:phage head morphogenesis protein n=1 Tax=Brachyspira hyodysenteriae TaxID=159 RepID=UPI00063D9A78|nr:phage minor head protein [Brachyspira hyodysenteriae]KLI19578.1 F protein [Brachyspira hyodysenteriae]
MIPQKALDYIKQKKLRIGFYYQDVWNEEHLTAFTAAKVMQLDILQDMKESIEKAIENGETLEQFKKNLLPILYQKGWTGKQLIEDPITKEIKEVYIDTPSRLKTIYETNLRSAYMKGRFDRAYNSTLHPYLMYRIGPSKNHRKEHLEWDGLILDKNDPFWLSHNPPNGWGCKCYTVAISKARKEKYEKEGIPTADGDGQTKKIKVKTQRPKIEYTTYINKRNGTISKVPKGVDPAFNFNQGNYNRDLVLFNDFMKKVQDKFPSQYQNIAETILRSEIKKEQFENWIKGAFEYDSNNPQNASVATGGQSSNPKSITAIGFIDSAVKNYLKNQNIDIGESITIGLEARLLNSIKAKRHAKKNEALEAKDAEYIIKCILEGKVYFQTDNKYIIYLYKIEDDKYLQISIATEINFSGRNSGITIPAVRNIQFINETQKKSKYDADTKKWIKIR